MDREPFRGVEPILLVVLHLGEIGFALAHDDVARGACATSAAVVLELDVVRDRDVEQRSGLAVIGKGVLRVVDLDGLSEWQERHAMDRHLSTPTP